MACHTVPALVNCVFVAWLYADVTMESSADEDAVAANMFIIESLQSRYLVHTIKMSQYIT